MTVILDCEDCGDQEKLNYVKTLTCIVIVTVSIRPEMTLGG